MPGRRIGAVVVAWVLALGLAWGIVGRPEHCPVISPAQAEAAATETVDWFARNQLTDGRWVYRYNIDTDEVDLQPHTVRHSGVTMSLYQAHDAGIAGSLDLADAGTEWSLSHLLRHDDWAAVAPTRQVPTGGTALLLAGLAIRRAATDDPRYDDEMRGMGRFLQAMTEPSGAVLAMWDTDAERPVPELYSVFFTGEAYFALALLAEVDPDGGWDATADRIGEYIATERDQVEGIFPPTSDHWAAYGLDASARGGDRALSDNERDYAQRLGGIFSVQVRYESQRTEEWLNRWALRGPRALAAGVGTLGEGLGSLWQLSQHDDALADDRDALAERLRCVAGMLVERQKDPTEAADTARPELVQGAWFRLGWTQKDDQQHALSALLLALPALEESAAGPASATGNGVGPTLWLVIIAVAVVNPLRLRRLVNQSSNHNSGGPPETAGGVDRWRTVAGTTITAAALGTVAAVAAPLLRGIDVSPPTALIAAGLVVGLTAVIDFVRPRIEPWVSGGRGSRPLELLAPLAVPGLLRPPAVLLVLAVAADAGIATGLAVALGITACAAAALRPATREPGVLATVLWRAVAVIAIVGGIAITVDGIFAV